MKHIPWGNLISLLTGCFLFAVLYGAIEYYTVDTGASGAPEWVRVHFRIGGTSLNGYQVFLAYPFWLLFALVISCWRVRKAAERVIAVTGCFVLLGLVEDASYFVWRMWQPKPGDVSGGRWIQPGEWTTCFLGAMSPGGVTIPWWYILAAGVVVAAFVGLSLSQKD